MTRSNDVQNSLTAKELYSSMSDKELMQAQIPQDPKESKKFKPNMQLAALRKDTIITDWLDAYPQTTQSVFLTYMNEFLETTGKRPKDLIPMEAAELKRDILRVKDGMTAENRFYAAKHLLKAMTSFALHYEKVIKYSYSQRVRTSLVKTVYVPEPPEIYQIANAASAISRPWNPRNRALIMTDWVTALRKNAIMELRWGAVLGYSEGDCPIPLRVGNESQTIGQNNLWCIDQKLSSYGVDYYYTFIAKEAFLDILDWKAWLTKNRGTVEKEDYLFSQHHKMQPGQCKIDDSYVYNNFKAAVKHANVKADTTFHKLRAAWKSVMIWAEVDEEVREVMMGHRPTRSKGNYFDNHDLEMVRNWYVRADWSKERKGRIAQLENKVNQQDATIAALYKNSEGRRLKELEEKHERLLRMFEEKFGEVPPQK